jgi:6-phosphogluconolactonase (cycloisomerase 2 family)
VYVVNSGGSSPVNSSSQCQSGYGISLFSVGGQGVLTQQPTCFSSQGMHPVWAASDSTGNYLYVLDQFGLGSDCPANPNPTWTPVKDGNGNTSCYGDITLFSADPNTGRLSLVLNQQIKDPNNPDQQITYFPVGYMPTMMATTGSCVFTLNSDQTVFPYAAGTSGQLTQTTNAIIPLTAAKRANSIVTGGTSIYVTDAGDVNSTGQVLPFTVGSTCSLNPITGGATQNLSPASNPVYSLVDSNSKYLYIVNQSSINSSSPSNSSISGFSIQTNGTLERLPNSSTTNPYSIGAGPNCMIEDPSHQYVYTANGDGTVTGKILDNPTGGLSDLSRGSSFTAVGQATCLAVSGNVD